MTETTFSPSRRQPVPSARRAERGFTLMELLIVMVIVGILATIAIPKLNFTQMQVDAGVLTVRSTLQNAQRLSISRQFDVIVSFDAASNRMRTIEDDNNNGRADAGERVVWTSLEDKVAFHVPPSGLGGSSGGAVAGPGVRTLDGMPSVIFHRDGAASTDLEVYLTSQRAKSDDYRAVQMVKSTGRTDWFKYIGGAWRRVSV